MKFATASYTLKNEKFVTDGIIDQENVFHTFISDYDELTHELHKYITVTEYNIEKELDTLIYTDWHELDLLYLDLIQKIKQQEFTQKINLL